MLRILLILFLLHGGLPAVEPDAVPLQPAADDDGLLRSLVRRTIIGAGLTVRTDELQISSNSLDAQGTLVRERGIEPLVTIGFENSYFGESRWGYSAVFGYTQFDMDEQKTGGSNTDVGTSAEGELFFLAPSVFYMFGDQNYDGWYFKPGFALGIGYLQAEGDVLLTSLPGNPRYAFDEQSDPLSISVGAYLEAGYKDWFFRFQVAGPIVDSDDVNMQGTTVGLSLGYTFHPFRNI